MKQLIILFIGLSISSFTQAQDSLSTANWTFGLIKGYAQIQGEVTPGNGFAFGLYGTKHVNDIFAVRLQVGMGDMQGLDNETSLNWVNHPVWNGTINSAIDYDEANSKSVYANYKTSYLESSLQGVFYFSQLPFFRNKSSFDGFLSAGIGGMRYMTTVDAAGLDEAIYNFASIEGLDAETKAKRLANINTIMDGDFETEASKGANIIPLYQVGAGVSWKLKNNISVSLSHRISFTGTDELDSYQWNENNELNGTNDIQHFTSLSIGYTLFKQKTPRPKTTLLMPIPRMSIAALEVAFPELPFVPMLKPEMPKRPKEEVEEKVVLTQAEEEVVKRAFDNLEFETGRSVIRSVSFVALDELADLLAKQSTWKLKISGHTDNIGRSENNKKLSRERAQAVRTYLVNRGIATERFIVLWFGEERPIANNKYKDGRQKNRRVEMEIVE